MKPSSIEGRFFGGIACALGLTAFLSVSTCSMAQTPYRIFSYDDQWRYSATGGLPGATWMVTNYNDSSWSTGNGPFAFPAGENVLVGPVNTELPRTGPIGGPQITTYYFRKRFTITGAALGTTLIASNVIDDGAACYVNGTEAGRFFMPAGALAYSTFSTRASDITQHGVEVLTLNPTNLMAGTTNNVFAVEVHDASTTSADIAFGMELWAIPPSMISITLQPRSATIALGTVATLTVEVSGGPTFYQWQTNDGSGVFVNIPGAVSAAYTNNPTVVGTNQFRVICYNGVNSVTSDVAVVSVVADTFGPRALSATVLEEPSLNRTNRIELVFNEPLSASTVHSPINPSLLINGTFRVVMMDSNVSVTISNSSYSPGTFPNPGTPPKVFLTVGTTNWHRGSNYYVTLNHIRDARTNVIAPDTQVPVAWPRNTDVMHGDHVWSFHAAAVFDPGVYDEPWYATNYVEGPWWSSGAGLLCGGPVTVTPCLGAFQTEMGYQPEPTLFRTTFVVPTNQGFASQLRFAFTVDDGVVFYVNGTELFRNNTPAPGTPMTAQTRASNGVSAVCQTNLVTVTNLFPGTNWLAAAVAQYTASGAPQDTVLGLVLRHTLLVPAVLPEVPIPRLNISAESTNRVRLWWDGPGYALEFATNLVTEGGWLEVTNMSNPYTNDLSPPQKFFRLRK